MKITFLGTGTSQGIPVIASEHPVGQSTNIKDKRLRTSAMFSWDSVNVNIDCSPDFRQQMLTNNVKHLEAILFTHEHSDHTAGLDDIRPFVNMQGDMPIYGEERIIANLKQRFDYIFATENRYEGAPSVQINVIDEKPFNLYGKQITPIRVWHGQLPIMGYRIENVAYITDAKYIDASQLEKLQNLDTLIINALREKEHPTHFTIGQALDIISELKPRRAFLTHISQALGFHDEVQAQLPKDVFLSYDNLLIDTEVY